MKSSNKKYNSLYNKYIKRIIDLPLALILQILLLPLVIIIAIAIFKGSGLPIFYRAERGGYQGKSFQIYKFRTMVKNADEIGGGTTALNDPRITKVGYFLRKTKFDEIPQLINIIKGEMSFVGPRPELLKYTFAYQDDENDILMVRPGMSDYSSLIYINLDEIVGESNTDEIYETIILPQKNKLRIKYAENVSLITDCRLMFLTIMKVIKKIFCFIMKIRKGIRL